MKDKIQIEFVISVFFFFFSKKRIIQIVISMFFKKENKSNSQTEMCLNFFLSQD